MFVLSYMYLTFWNFRHRLVRLYWYTYNFFLHIFTTRLDVRNMFTILSSHFVNMSRHATHLTDAFDWTLRSGRMRCSQLWSWASLQSDSSIADEQLGDERCQVWGALVLPFCLVEMKNVHGHNDCKSFAEVQYFVFASRYLRGYQLAGYWTRQLRQHIGRSRETLVGEGRKEGNSVLKGDVLLFVEVQYLKKG